MYATTTTLALAAPTFLKEIRAKIPNEHLYGNDPSKKMKILVQDVLIIVKGDHLPTRKSGLLRKYKYQQDSRCCTCKASALFKGNQNSLHARIMKPNAVITTVGVNPRLNGSHIHKGKTTSLPEEPESTRNAHIQTNTIAEGNRHRGTKSGKKNL